MNIYIENRQFWNHITYSFETILRCIREYDFTFYDVKDNQYAPRSIYYGKNIPKEFEGIIINEGTLFSDSYLKKECLPKLPLKRIDDIPILFDSEDESIPQIIHSDMQTIINFDIIQSSFFLITGCEEIINWDDDYDIHSRYVVTQRILYREKMYDRPLINIYALMLRQEMGRLKFDINRKEYPSYACISHDVDRPFAEIKGCENMINKIKRRLGKNVKFKISKGFEFILQTEEKNKIKSSWYFGASENKREYGFEYKLEAADIQAVIDKIRYKGDEIGWHYSYPAAFDHIQMKKEYVHFAEIMGEKPVSGRNHYLRYSVPNSWNEYRRLGMIYDSTLGSAEHEGFTYGICTPFQLFDAVRGVNLEVWEIPLIVMDNTLCEAGLYRSLGQREVVDVIHRLVQEVKKYNGVFSILWHNSSLKNTKWRQWEDTYLLIMQYLSSELVCQSGIQIIKEYNNAEAVSQKTGNRQYTKLYLNEAKGV